VKWLLGIHSPNEFLLLFYVCLFFLLGNQFSFSSRWHPFLLFAGTDPRDPHSPVVPRCRTSPTPLRTVRGTLDFLYHFFNFNLLSQTTVFVHIFFAPNILQFEDWLCEKLKALMDDSAVPHDQSSFSINCGQYF